jgi:hypothetical protein
MNLWSRKAILDVDTLRVEFGDGIGLDVEFDVSKTWTPDPNSSTVKIYNLNKDHRTALLAAADKGTVRVKLEAGYKEGTSVLYSGDFHFVNVRRDGPDVVTELSLKDGAKTIASNALSKSYVAGTQIDSVLKDLAAATEFGFGNLADVVATAQIEGVGNVFKYPTAVNGPAYYSLVRLAASAGLEVSVQDGALQFLEIGGGLRKTATLLSPETGLIGSPMIDTGKKKAVILRARALIQPGLDPGNQIRVKCDGFDGAFIVRRVKYTGNTAGSEWFANLEAKPV